ncbi:hypothetical protein FOL47_009457 [Perkinsus chesapeaki]|uniref:Kinesin motor domain-containing protein n=1 Tax=Perkinsus chesapeaki TaxID=330153 RepID=A0A7J6MRU4_PERCH|nr:hypothetical protein FOL47_009457 [Perkinsus chesapeaki]
MPAKKSAENEVPSLGFDPARNGADVPRRKIGSSGELITDAVLKAMPGKPSMLLVRLSIPNKANEGGDNEIRKVNVTLDWPSFTVDDSAVAGTTVECGEAMAEWEENAEGDRRRWEKEFPIEVNFDVARSIASAVMWMNVKESRSFEGEENEAEEASERVPLYLAPLLVGKPAKVRSRHTSINATVQVVGETANVLSAELLEALHPMVVKVGPMKNLPDEESMRARISFWGFTPTASTDHWLYPIEIGFFPGIYSTRHFWEACREASSAPRVEIIKSDGRKDIIVGMALLSALDLLRLDKVETCGVVNIVPPKNAGRKLSPGDDSAGAANGHLKCPEILSVEPIKLSDKPKRLPLIPWLELDTTVQYIIRMAGPIREVRGACSKEEGENVSEVVDEGDIGRLCLIFGYKASRDGARGLVKFVNDYNKNVMGGTLSRLVEVTEEQKKKILTSWLVMDKRQRIWCFEGPRRVVAELYRFVSTETSIQKHGRALYHPQCQWTDRIYSDLSMRLFVVKLRKPLRNLLIARVDCGGDSLSRLGELQLCQSIWHLKMSRSVWPSVEDLYDIQTKYGDFVSDSEVVGGCLGDAEDQSRRKRMGRRSSATTAASSPRSAAYASEAQDMSKGEIQVLRKRKPTARERSTHVESHNPNFDKVLMERRKRKYQVEKIIDRPIEDLIKKALEKRRTYDGASGPFNYSIQTYNTVVGAEQKRLRDEFSDGVYTFGMSNAADPVENDPSSKAAASRECLNNTLDLGRMNEGRASLKERLAAAKLATDRRRVEWRHPRPSSPSAYRRADHIHTVPLSESRLEELSGAMPWEPAINDFIVLQSQRVPKCRVGVPVDPQAFDPKSTSKRFLTEFGPSEIYKSVHYSCDVLAAEAVERAKKDKEVFKHQMKAVSGNRVTFGGEQGSEEEERRKKRWMTKGTIMLGKCKEAGSGCLDAKLGYGLREGPPMKLGIDFSKRKVPKSLGAKYGERVGWVNGNLGISDRESNERDYYREADIGREFEARMRGNHTAAPYNVQSGCFVPRLDVDDVRGELNQSGLLIGEPAEPAPWRHTAVVGKINDFDLWKQRGRGPFPTSRSGNKSAARSSSKAAGGTPTKSYDPVEWAEKKRIAIARAEKLKVERRKAKEAAARSEENGGEGERQRGESEEELLLMHDNIESRIKNIIVLLLFRYYCPYAISRISSSWSLVEAYLKGKGEVPTVDTDGSAVQWKWIGPGDSRENTNEDKLRPVSSLPVESVPTRSDSRAEVYAGQHQAVESLPASLAQKLDRRRDRLKERQQKAYASRILENRNAAPKESSRPLQPRASKSALGSTEEGKRGVAGGGKKADGKIRSLAMNVLGFSAHHRPGKGRHWSPQAPAPPTRKPPPPPPPPPRPVLPKREGISSASTVATNKGSRRDDDNGRKRKVKGVVQQREDPNRKLWILTEFLEDCVFYRNLVRIRAWERKAERHFDRAGERSLDDSQIENLDRLIFEEENLVRLHGLVLWKVRKRPLFEKEESIKLEYDVVSCVDENTITLHNCLYQADLKRPLISHLSSKFARVFDESADNEFVYKNSGSQEMVLNACRGGLSTMFMFGQTGSGKTHTMTSIESRAAKDIFQNIPEGSTVTVCFNEICGKHVFDLMAAKRTEVRLRDAGNNTVLLEGAVSVPVEDSEKLIDIIKQSHTRRKTETTGANDVSSRSHAVCRISIALPGVKAVGCLVLVDCAGTERRKDSFYHDKVRQQEGAEINASLHALKECIRYRMLRQPSEKESGSSSFVPFRGSALTRVLAEGFVREDALLHVMATVSPCATDIDHSISTLKAVSMLSSVDDSLKEVRQTELFPIVKKELPKHPKHWDEEEEAERVDRQSRRGFTGYLSEEVRLTKWMSTVCNDTSSLLAKLSAGSSSNGSFLGGFISSFLMILCAELGDKTFFIAAILSMRNSAAVVFAGAIAALATMTVLSAGLGLLLPALLSKKVTHYACIALFTYFGIRLLKDACDADDSAESGELAEVEMSVKKKNEEHDRDTVDEQGAQMEEGEATADNASPSLHWYSKENRAVLVQSFVMSFLAEWGDRSQISTIALASSKNPYGVMLGGILGHCICSGIAVIGGRLLASRISERQVAVAGGILFLVFALSSLLLGVEDSAPAVG